VAWDATTGVRSVSPPSACARSTAPAAAPIDAGVPVAARATKKASTVTVTRARIARSL
jgi:hypothetical protein